MTGDARTPIALYVGRLSQEKNLGHLLAMIEDIERVDGWLVVVGDGPIRPGLVRALIGRRATFTGYLRDEALASAYTSSDCLCPSFTDRDIWPGGSRGDGQWPSGRRV